MKTETIYKSVVETLKKRHLFGSFIYGYVPFQKELCFNLNLSRNTITNKIILSTKNNFKDNGIFTVIRAIEFLLYKKRDSNLEKKEILDYYLEDYFNENKEKYKTTKTNVFFQMLFGSLFASVGLILFTFMASFFLSYEIILTIIICIWLSIIYVQYKLCG